MIEPKGIEAIYPAAHGCFISVCKSLMEMDQMRKNMNVYPNVYSLPAVHNTMWEQRFVC